MLLGAVVGAAVYLTLPPSPDQFNHAYLGWRLFMGDVPYRQTLDPNWPGVMGLHALAVWIFGVNLWSWRAFDMLLFAASAALLCDLARRAAGSSAGRICALLCPVVYAAAGSWVAGQHDMSAAQFMVAALWFHVRALERRQPAWQWGAGAMLALAMLNKPTVGVLLPLMIAQALLLGQGLRRVAVHAVLAGAGLLVGLALAAWAITLFGTTWTELYEATWLYNVSSQYVVDLTMKQTSFADVLQTMLVQLGLRWVDLVVVCLPGVAWLVRGPHRSLAGTALLVLWLAGVGSYFAQARGWAYQLAPALVALIGLAAVGLATLGRWRREAPGRRLPWLLLAGAVALLVARQGERWIETYGALPQVLMTGDFSAHRARFRENDGLNVAEAEAFARRVRQAPPTRCVLVVGRGSAINYLSRHRQPTRFYYFPMLIRAVPPLPMAEKWQQAWIGELGAARCHYALIDKTIHAEWLPTKGPASDALRDFLQGYAEAGTVGGDDGLRLYERRTPR